jgi:hypothetical protein
MLFRSPILFQQEKWADSFEDLLFKLLLHVWHSGAPKNSPCLQENCSLIKGTKRSQHITTGLAECGSAPTKVQVKCDRDSKKEDIFSGSRVSESVFVGGTWLEEWRGRSDGHRDQNKQKPRAGDRRKQESQWRPAASPVYMSTCKVGSAEQTYKASQARMWHFHWSPKVP